MVAARRSEDREGRGLPRGARGRYAPPPQLFPLVPTAVMDFEHAHHLLIARDADGTYLIRHRDSGRLIASTADPATLQRLLMALGKTETR